MDDLGFRFDEPVVIVDGWAHGLGCPKLPADLSAHAHRIAAGQVYRSQRSPRQCWTCAPSFTTLLSHEVSRHNGKQSPEPNPTGTDATDASR